MDCEKVIYTCSQTHCFSMYPSTCQRAPVLFSSHQTSQYVIPNWHKKMHNANAINPQAALAILTITILTKFRLFSFFAFHGDTSKIAVLLACEFNSGNSIDMFCVFLVVGVSLGNFGYPGNVPPLRQSDERRQQGNQESVRKHFEGEFRKMLPINHLPV